MKKLALCLAVTSALGLTACDDTTYNDVANAAEPVTPASRMVFDPSNGELSVPNDLLFTDTTDGTLNIPVADPADYGDPQNALNALDGWSTENAFVLRTDFPAGVSLNQASASAPGAVRIFEAVMGASRTDADCAEVPQGAACKIVGELTFGVDFVTGPSGNDVGVVFLKPLKPATSYLMASTTILQDDMGRGIQGSTSYDLVAQDITTHPLSSEDQLALQGVINSFETVLSEQGGVDKDSINLSWSVTTESTGVVLNTIKQVMVADPANMPQGGVIDTTCTALDILSAGLTGRPECNLFQLDSPLVDPTAPESAMFAAAKFHAGQVALPHFSDRVDPLNGRWMANCDSGATLAGYIAAGGEVPADPVSDNDALCRAFGLVDIGIDPDRHLTQYNPIPALTGDAALHGAVLVDVQMTIPDVNVANAIRPTLGLPALVEPDAGWPVVMLYHGITSQKEDMMSLTGLLSVFGMATVAIDHPLHGSRGYDLDGDGNDDVNASTNSATDYMNLASLLTTRDNLRQSIADQLGLRIALHNLAGANINAMDVSFIGHSLGAITGTTFLALTNTSMGNEVADAMYKVNAASLASPGGGIANFLLESPSFGPLIQATLAISSNENFLNWYLAGGNLPPGHPDYDETAFVTAYLTWYQTEATDEDKAQLAADTSSFVFAAQTVTEAGDPNNYAPMLVANGTPVLAFEMVGDGMDNLSDRVIPNTTSSPIAGTEPLFAYLNLPAVTGNVAGAEPANGAVRFLFGHHSSLLDPRPIAGVAEDNTGAVTAMMQQMIATYLANGGRAIFVGDGGALIQGGE